MVCFHTKIRCRFQRYDFFVYEYFACGSIEASQSSKLFHISENIFGENIFFLLVDKFDESLYLVSHLALNTRKIPLAPCATTFYSWVLIFKSNWIFLCKSCLICNKRSSQPTNFSGISKQLIEANVQSFIADSKHEWSIVNCKQRMSQRCDWPLGTQLKLNSFQL